MYNLLFPLFSVCSTSWPFIQYMVSNSKRHVTTWQVNHNSTGSWASKDHWLNFPDDRLQVPVDIVEIVLSLFNWLSSVYLNMRLFFKCWSEDTSLRPSKKAALSQLNQMSVVFLKNRLYNHLFTEMKTVMTSEMISAGGGEGGGVECNNNLIWAQIQWYIYTASQNDN